MSSSGELNTNLIDMKIDDFLKEEMNWTDRDLEYRPVIGYWKVTELLQKWGEKQLLLHGVSGSDILILLERKFPTKYEIHRGSIEQTKNLILTTDDKKFAERLVGNYNH